MESRIASISIIVEDDTNISELNSLLHENSSYILGRMGIPYREKGVNIISIAIDAPQDIINSLSGRIGRINGVKSKVLYSSVISEVNN